MFVSIFDSADQTPADLGGKGYGLWYMQSKGVNVPPALILPTAICVEYMKKPSVVMKDVAKNLHRVFEFFNEKMGYMPLVSVRSGARVSMPGMMDTILNVGLDPTSIPVWGEKLGMACTEDSYSRLIEMYGSVVKEIPRQAFHDLSVEARLALYTKFTGEAFPNAKAQLLGAVEAVFQSWNNERAKVYRKQYKIPETWGTAVVIQAMVFGNMNDQSGTGVLFTRNPDSGEAGVTGEFLINAQGEDVVAGIKTPMKLEEMAAWNLPVYQELLKTVVALEVDRKDMQDVEFTIQDGKLYVLQTRNAKRSAPAAMRIAVEMLAEGLIDDAELLKRVDRKLYATCQLPVIDPKFKKNPTYQGIPACSGVVSGVVVYTAKAAIDCTVPCILVTQETTPDDIAGMIAAKGVVTMHGGSTSHAAVVARGMDKPCVVGVGEHLTSFKAGSTISMDGSTGRIWLNEVVPVIESKDSPAVKKYEQVVQASSGAKLISDDPNADSDVLDLTAFLLFPNQVVEKVMARLTKSEKHFIVDLGCKAGSPEFQFTNIFASPDSLAHEALQALNSQVSNDQRKRFKVYGGKKHSAFHQLDTVTSLEELVLAEGSFVMDAAQSPAIDKVLDWKLSQGANPVQIGVLNAANPVLSVAQMMQALS